MEAYRYRRDQLEDWTAAVLRRADVPSEQAALAGRVLVRTDARGFDTHGLTRLKTYVDKLGSGEVTAAAEPLESGDDHFLRIDARGILGQIAGPLALDRMCERARNHPVVAGQLLDAGHLGALGLHVLPVAEAGMIGLMFQATPPTMGLPGGRRAVIGNNPFALAAPRSNGPPIVVDMACCVAARGKILLAARDGRPIPPDWALDEDGRTTTDAERALRGTLLPFAGHKGIAMAMMVEVLAGSLSGSAFETSLNRARTAAGHLSAFLLVINPDLVTGWAAYDAHVAAWTAHVRAEGGPNARIPGERAHEAEREADQAGVLLSASVASELEALGASVGVPFALERLVSRRQEVL